MSSLREQVLARVAALLTPQATGAVSSARSREISITRELSPAIVVMPVSSELARVMGGKQDRNGFEFAVEIFVRGDTWDSLADPIDVAAHALLAADVDNTTTASALGSLVSDLQRVGEAFESQEADRTAGTLTVRYRATFLTSTRAIDRSWP